MNKLYLIVGIVIVLSILIFVGNYFLINKPIPKEEQHIKLYQGPVPEGYDLNYFRETGITKKIGVE